MHTWPHADTETRSRLVMLAPPFTSLRRAVMDTHFGADSSDKASDIPHISPWKQNRSTTALVIFPSLLCTLLSIFSIPAGLSCCSFSASLQGSPVVLKLCHYIDAWSLYVYFRLICWTIRVSSGPTVLGRTVHWTTSYCGINKILHYCYFYFYYKPAEVLLP